MSWVAIGAAAVGAVGAGMQADAAGDAADSQAAATRDANGRLNDATAQVRADLAPYSSYGFRATNKMAELMGLRGGNGASRTLDDIRHDLIQNYGYAPDGPTIDNAAQSAYEGQFGKQEGGYFLTPFTGQNLQNDPGYQFGLNEGQKAIDRRAATGGNYFSGGALKAANRFGTDYAGTKFNEAFNRDAATKNQMFNFLSGGMSLGQNSAAQMGNAGQNMAQQVGVNTTALGNAQGAAGIAGANAWSNGLQNAYGAYQNNELMKQLNAPKLSNTSSGWGTGSAYGNQDYGQYF